MTIIFDKLENILIEWKIFNKNEKINSEEKKYIKKSIIDRINILFQTIDINDIEFLEHKKHNIEQQHIVVKINSKI